jgi:hypothetical protein
MRNLDGWMDDGTDDDTNGWKGRPPPDRLRILYKYPLLLMLNYKKTGRNYPTPLKMDG